jgi:hypothetical protein
VPFRLPPMAFTQAPILINSHRITRKISTWLMNIPCFSVCFRGKYEISGDDIARASVVHPEQVLEMTRS